MPARGDQLACSIDMRQYAPSSEYLRERERGGRERQREGGREGKWGGYLRERERQSEEGNNSGR